MPVICADVDTHVRKPIRYGKRCCLFLSPNQKSPTFACSFSSSGFRSSISSVIYARCEFRHFPNYLPNPPLLFSFSSQAPRSSKASQISTLVSVSPGRLIHSTASFLSHFRSLLPDTVLVAVAPAAQAPILVPAPAPGSNPTPAPQAPVPPAPVPPAPDLRSDPETSFLLLYWLPISCCTLLM